MKRVAFPNEGTPALNSGSLDLSITLAVDYFP